MSEYRAEHLVGFGITHLNSVDSTAARRQKRTERTARSERPEVNVVVVFALDVVVSERVSLVGIVPSESGFDFVRDTGAVVLTNVSRSVFYSVDRSDLCSIRGCNGFSSIVVCEFLDHCL
jgi:hypothetical protein